MTPAFLLARLVALFPDFAAYWDDPRNCFREDDGSFNFIGIFAEFGWFFDERQENLAADQIAAVGAIVSECMDSPDEELSNSAATGFLEPRAGEPKGAILKPYLSGEALKFHRSWESIVGTNG